jgi:hypothetical protein
MTFYDAFIYSFSFPHPIATHLEGWAGMLMNWTYCRRRKRKIMTILVTYNTMIEGREMRNEK